MSGVNSCGEVNTFHFPIVVVSEEGWISRPLADESEESETSQHNYPAMSCKLLILLYKTSRMMAEESDV